MKEEILDIAKKLYHNHLTPETATTLLLDLFAVSGSLPLDSEVINNCPQSSFGAREVWMMGVVWLKQRVLKGNDR